MADFIYNEDSPAVHCVDRHIQAIKDTIYEANYKINAYINEDRAVIKELETLRDHLLALKEQDDE